MCLAASDRRKGFRRWQPVSQPASLTLTHAARTVAIRSYTYVRTPIVRRLDVRGILATTSERRSKGRPTGSPVVTATRSLARSQRNGLRAKTVNRLRTLRRQHCAYARQTRSIPYARVSTSTRVQSSQVYSTSEHCSVHKLCVHRGKNNRNTPATGNVVRRGDDCSTGE